MKLSMIAEPSVLGEGIEAKADHLAQRLLQSRWSGKDRHSPEAIRAFIISLSGWDPTGEQAKYVPYIVRQLANGSLTAEPGKQEDLDRIAAALKYFNTNYKSPQWTLPRDINQIRNWRELEDAANADTTAYQSKREQKRKITTGAEEIGSITVPNQYKTTYAIYRVTEPEALVMLGMGTKWCTSTLSTQSWQYDHETSTHNRIDLTKDAPPTVYYPLWHKNAGEQRSLQYMEFGTLKGYPMTAAQYLGFAADSPTPAEAYGPLYIILQTDSGPKSNGIGRSGQVGQCTHDMSEFKNAVDEEITVISPALRYAIQKWNIPEIKKLLVRTNNDDTDLDNIENMTGFPIKPKRVDSQDITLYIEVPTRYGRDDTKTTTMHLTPTATYAWPNRPVDPDAWYANLISKGPMKIAWVNESYVPVLSRSGDTWYATRHWNDEPDMERWTSWMLEDEPLDSVTLIDVINIAHNTGLPVPDIQHSMTRNRYDKASRHQETKVFLDNLTQLLDELLEED